MKNIAVVVNKKAGSVDSTVVRDTIIDAFRPWNCTVTVFDVPGSSLATTAKEASSTFDIVVAAGGDGTMNAVASALVDSEATMGVLPMGTLNHFAKDLSIPQDISAAAYTIVHGEPKMVDVAYVNNKMFLNNSSIGIYPSMVRNRDEQQRTIGLSKWPAMFLAAVKAFREYRMFAVKLITPNQSLVVRTPFVFVGNNVYNTQLNSLGTRDGLTDGTLSVYTLKNPTRWRLLTTIFDVMRGTLEQAEDFELHTVEELLLTMKRPSTHASFDGEVERFTTPLHYRIAPSSLRVMLPCG